MTDFAQIAPPPPSPRCEIARGDSLVVLGCVPSGSCDMLLTDPPYCSGGATRTDRKASTSSKYQANDAAVKFADFPGDARDERSFVKWSAMWMAECWRILRPGASAVVFSDWRQLANTCDALQIAGFVFRGIVPWIKTSARPQPNSYRTDCEFAAWATKGPIDRRPTPDAKYLPGCYKYGAPSSKDRKHATQKPVALMRDLMAIAPEGGTILDPFMGSGSTGIACAETGRSFIGIEMSEHYHAVARERLSRAFW